MPRAIVSKTTISKAIAAQATAFTATAIALLLLPRLAGACPMCAGQAQPGGTARIIALGVMLLLPFAVAIIAFRALRHAVGMATDKHPTDAAAIDAERATAGGMRDPSP